MASPVVVGTGISTDEIVALGRRVGLVPSAGRQLLTDSSAAGQALLVSL
jgi:hypothetical protein